ncbi:intracellular PHB depolymerase PhaZ [Cupriavidus basilensis OR16]|uniref:Intracellular PHB depolymerase PhaZ n=1 Tax=Cupriavidus basilensis OR16 TaxID=1127483 RepID=H1RZR2_9BURK|nr:polyhydroxyalkanoate depolymerase [Cupriavidus basilensis]EHP44128.1 intracellular PHB depolymerase PhaZ [Cupriavidus basilensis OR16]
MYQLYELHSAAWAPFLPWLQASASFLEAFENVPSAVPTRHLAAGFQLLVRLWKRYPKPQFGLAKTLIDGHRVAVSETVVLDKAFCRLLHFERATRHSQPVVLLVAPLSGHHATLLRDTVRVMLPDFDVFLTDWRDGREVPLAAGAFHLDDYVAYMREFIDYLGPDLHIVSICQSTVPVLAAVSLMASRGEPTPRSLTLIGGPVDAQREPTTVDELAVNKSLDWFEREMIDTVPAHYPGAGRRVCPGFRQRMAFMAMKADHHLRSHLNYYFDVAAGNTEAAQMHRSFYDEYNAVLDMAAEYYLDTVRVVFQECRLARGTWRVCGEHVRPGDIRASALITVEGEHDDICGPGQTRAAHDLCTGIEASRKHHLTARGCGHYGIFSGTRWRTEVYPRIRSLIYGYTPVPAAC